MKKEAWISPVNVVLALAVAVLVVSAAVASVLFDRAAYDTFQEKAELPARVGLSEAAVLENYNALIDYNSLFYRGALEFPDLPVSESGRVHFAEVKAIFDAFQIALILSAAAVALGCIRLFRKRRFRFLVLGGVFALLIPALVSAVMGLVGWDAFFVLFHRLAFANDFWVFDAVSDPVILILPDAFFLGCLVRIVAAIVVSAVLLIAVPLCAARVRRLAG